LSKKLYWLGRNYYRRAAKAKESGAKSKFLDEAFVNLKKSVKNNKKNYKARTLLGYIYLQKADQELGMAEVSQCLRGDDGKESRSAADTLSKRAREQFEAAVEAEPKCTSSWLGLVNVAMHFNEYEKAIKLGRKVIDTLLAGGIKADCSSAGDKAVAWANMGWAHFHKRRLVRASKNLRQALFLAPKFCLAHYWLGRVLYAQGKHEEAARELEYTARTFGLPQAAHQYLGLAKLKLGEKQSARAAFRRCVRLAPNSCTAEECKRYLRVMVRGESTEAETGKDVEK
jgi:tetratricopeptide (TPR) repeat protein